jgi:hypothetical protein
MSELKYFFGWIKEHVGLIVGLILASPVAATAAYHGVPAWVSFTVIYWAAAAIITLAIWFLRTKMHISLIIKRKKL